MASDAIAPVAPDELGTALDETLVLLDITVCEQFTLGIKEILPALARHLERGIFRSNLWRFSLELL